MVVLTEPPVPENVEAIRTSPTTIQVTWDEPPQTHVIAMYQVRYFHLHDDDMSIWHYMDTDGPTTVVLLTEKIERDKPYEIRVRAMSTHERWSNYSRSITLNQFVQGLCNEMFNFMFSSLILSTCSGK